MIANVLALLLKGCRQRLSPVCVRRMNRFGRGSNTIFDVSRGKPFSSRDFTNRAKLKVWHELEQCMFSEFDRVRSYKRCPELEAAAYLFARVAFFFLSRSWLPDSDYVIVCVWCRLLVFIDREDIPSVDFLNEYHVLKCPNCDYVTRTGVWVVCDIPAYRHMNFLDVKFTDFCDVRKGKETDLWDRVPDLLTPAELAGLDSIAVCVQCKLRMINVVLLPCRESYLCSLCAATLKTCLRCNERVQAQTLMILA
jgi:hypothetical protein